MRERLLSDSHRAASREASSCLRGCGLDNQHQGDDGWGNGLTLATCIFPQCLAIFSESRLTSSGRMRDLREPMPLEILWLTCTCLPQSPAHSGVVPVIDRSALPKTPPRSCHPASGGGQSLLHPTTTILAPEKWSVLLTIPRQPMGGPVLEFGMLFVKNVTKVLSLLSNILSTDETSSGTTAARIATRIHSHPRVGPSSTV